MGAIGRIQERGLKGGPITFEPSLGRGDVQEVTCEDVKDVGRTVIMLILMRTMVVFLMVVFLRVVFLMVVFLMSTVPDAVLLEWSLPGP